MGIDKLVVYAPSYIADGTRPRPAADVPDRLQALLDDGHRDEAAVLFLTEQVGVPTEMVQGMQASQSWGWFTGLAHTLPYDVAVCGPGCVLPADRLATIAVPALAIDGGNSPDWLEIGRASCRERV